MPQTPDGTPFADIRREMDPGLVAEAAIERSRYRGGGGNEREICGME